MWPRKIKTIIILIIIISVTNTWGLITEQRPKSVPKNGRKLVVLVASLSDPNLKDHHIDQNWNMIIFLLYFSLGHDDGRVPGVLHCKVPNQQEYRIYIERVQEQYIGIPMTCASPDLCFNFAGSHVWKAEVPPLQSSKWGVACKVQGQVWGVHAGPTQL